MPILPLFLTQEDYDAIQSDLASGKTFAQALSGAIDSLQLAEGDAADQLSVQSARLTEGETVNAAQDAAIATMKNKDLSIEQFAIGINSDLQTQKGRIAALETSDGKQAGDIATIKTLNATQDGRLSSLEGWKATTDGTLNGLKGADATLGNRISTLEQAPKPVNYQPQIDALTAQIKTVEDRQPINYQPAIDALGRDLATRLDALVKRIEALEKPVEPLPS